MDSDIMSTTLLAAVHNVAFLRQILAEQEALVRQRRLKWEADNQSLLDAAAKGKLALTIAEEDLRLKAIHAYRETNNKVPGPGLGIRETTVLRYTPEKALAWAQKHGLALALDKQAFESFAKVQEFPFVTKELVIIATIATDMEKALASDRSG